MTPEPPRERVLYVEEMGREPAPPSDDETRKQFEYRSRSGLTAIDFLSNRDPGDEDDGPAVLDGQESLL